MRGDEPSFRTPGQLSKDEFPACAGMNRNGGVPDLIDKRVPRMRGDEPHYTTERAPTDWEFPACAGMNRRLGTTRMDVAGVPRMRGDEPVLPANGPCVRASSPHARG